MSADSKIGIVSGWIVSLLPAAMLIFSGVIKIMHTPEMDVEVAKIGWKGEYLPTLGMVEIACALIYLVPYTSVLGAILLTGYLGGAVATHARLGEMQMFGAVGVGVFVWLGLYLRDSRIRALVPIRR